MSTKKTNVPPRNSPTAVTIVLLGLFFLSGCATYQANVVPARIMLAQQEIPESQLLDVGILPFESREITEEEARQKGTSNETRRAEGHYIPYHLKNTLQLSSQWGAVRVIPAKTNSFDVLVRGRIVESNGEHLTVEVDVSDATGKQWFTREYRMEATPESYRGNMPGLEDAYQYLYNSIANDMAVYKQKLVTAEVSNIRTTAKLKYAADFVPDAFSEYLVAGEGDTTRVDWIPAGDDPMMARVMDIREREYMYIDTLNEQYDAYYNEVWTSYENWRQLNMVERRAIREIERRALRRKLIGALMIVAAIAGGASDSGYVTAAQTGLVLVGTHVIVSGFNVSREAEIHEAAIQELSESFSSEMKPAVVEFEGRQYELTGSAKEQFEQWRVLLKKIYFAEKGVESNPAAEGGAPGASESP